MSSSTFFNKSTVWQALPVNATRQTKIARDTSNQICACVRPRGSRFGLSGVERVTFSLISVGEQSMKMLICGRKFNNKVRSIGQISE